MASGYSFPEDYLRYFIVGDRLALVTSKSTASDVDFEPIDESVEDGILLEFSSQPDEIEKLSDIPDTDDTLHKALVYYVLWKLFEDKQGDENFKQEKKYERLWKSEIKANAGRSKIGGTRGIVPFNLK